MKKYIVGAVLSFGILVSPAFTQAASLTDAQVQAILGLLSSFGADSATIASVTTALTGVAAPTTGQTFCYNFSRDLGIGLPINDSEAASLDTVFLKQGISGDDFSSFDEDVAARVVRFQAKYGIRQTGYVGPLTRAKLNALYKCGNGEYPTPQPSPVPTVEVSPSSISEQVKCVFSGATSEQNCLGYLPSKTVGDPIRYSCSGIGTCVVTVSGEKGRPITWGSSCGGGVYTTIDGNSEYANFSCVTSTSTISATINSTAFSTSRPTITGTASGLSGVRLSLKIGSRVQYSSTRIEVDANGTWSHQVTEAIPAGAYRAILVTADPKRSEGVVVAEGQINVTGNDVAQCSTYNSPPVITSITPSSGPVGTTIEIQGCNFLGFEGDKEIWFTNSKGEKGFLNGQMDETTRTSNTIARVTLSQKLCKINSYSGLDCPVLDLAPGAYTVHSNSWGGNSNMVNFAVTN